MIVKYLNKVVSNNGKWIVHAHIDPFNPLNLPANTVRVRTSDGNAPIKTRLTTYETATLVAGTTDVYDVYKSGTTLNDMFMDSTNIVEILGANTSNITRMFSMFHNCSSLTNITTFDTTTVSNMSYMFYGCINVQSGALNFYQQASSQTTPPSVYSNAFTNCGSNTTTGSAELSQIPISWGGTSYGFNEVTIQTESGNQTWTYNITQLSTPSYTNISNVTANNYNMGDQHYYTPSSLSSYTGYEEYNDYIPAWMYYPPHNTLADGYHLPTKTEIMALLDSYPIQGLKSLNGWNTNNGSDNVGFNAMPTGYCQRTSGESGWIYTAADAGNSFVIFCIDDELLANHYTYDSGEGIYYHDDQVSDYHVVKSFNIFDDGTYSFTEPKPYSSDRYALNIRLIKN